MNSDIEYYFGLSSPWSYMGLRRLREFATRSGSRIHYRPINVPMLFEATGTLPLPQRPKARQDYRMVELERWRNHLGVTLNLEPKFFPVSDVFANRVVTAVGEKGIDVGDLCEALHQCVWVRDLNIDDEEVVKGVLSDAGLQADDIIADAKSPEIEAVMDDFTKQAIERGVFGMPSYVIEGEPFWGQDRLELVAKKLGLHP